MQNELVIRTAFKRGFRVDENGNLMSCKGIALKVHTTKAGYFETNVRINNKLHHLPVHRLCAYQKYGEQLFSAQCVRHMDGNQQNNRPDNLCLGSHSQNMMDRPYRTRRALALNASQHQLNYHTDEEVSHIKQFYARTGSYKLTMQHFGLTSKGTLFYMLNRR